MPDSNNALLDAIANPRQVDVLGAYRGANNILQGQWAVREMQARQLAGQAQQGAINPATGEYSPERYRQNLAAAGPDAALAAQSGLAANQALSSDQLNQAKDKLGWVAKASGAALTAGDFSDAAVMRVLQQGSADKMLTMPEIARQLATLPPDPAGRKAWFEQHLNQAMSTQQQLELRYGRPITVDTGPAVVGGTQPIQGGALNIPPQPGVPKYVGPETAGSKVEWTNSDGVTQQGTWAQFAIEHGAGHVVGGARPVAPTSGGKRDYTGEPNPLLGGLPNPAEGAAGPAPVPAPAANGTGYKSTPGPAPGTVEAAKDTATQSAGMGTALVSRADAVPTNKANYANMLDDLRKLDTMGPGTERETFINAFLQKITGKGITMSREQVAGSESFTKLANMIAAQQLQALGSTDARQSLAMGANPHLELSKLGNEQIIHMLQGNEDAINAKAQAWQKWTAPKSQGGLGNSSGSYGQFTNDFNHNFDPRVFQQQYMSPKEVADLRANLARTPGAAAKFRHDYQYALDQHWIGS